MFDWQNFLKYIHCVGINGRTFASVPNYPLSPEGGSLDAPLEYRYMTDSQKHEWGKALGTNVLIHDLTLSSDVNKGLSVSIDAIDYVINARPISD